MGRDKGKQILVSRFCLRDSKKISFFFARSHRDIGFMKLGTSSGGVAEVICDSWRSRQGDKREDDAVGGGDTAHGRIKGGDEGGEKLRVKEGERGTRSELHL